MTRRDVADVLIVVWMLATLGLILAAYMGLLP